MAHLCGVRSELRAFLPLPAVAVCGLCYWHCAAALLKRKKDRSDWNCTHCRACSGMELYRLTRETSTSNSCCARQGSRVGVSQRCDVLYAVPLWKYAINSDAKYAINSGPSRHREMSRCAGFAIGTPAVAWESHFILCFCVLLPRLFPSCFGLQNESVFGFWSVGTGYLPVTKRSSRCALFLRETCKMRVGVSSTKREFFRTVFTRAGVGGFKRVAVAIIITISSLDRCQILLDALNVCCGCQLSEGYHTGI